MGIQPKKNTNIILPETEYIGTLEKVEYKPNAEDPKKVLLYFRPDEHDVLISKAYGVSLRAGSPLRKDIETLQGGPINEVELLSTYIVEKHLGKRCKFGVLHKTGSGGRTAMAATTISPAENEGGVPTHIASPTMRLKFCDGSKSTSS